MCGRIIQSTGPVNLAIVDALDVRDHRLDNFPRRYNGAPSQELLVIRENHKTGERTLEPLRWGLIPYWCKDPDALATLTVLRIASCNVSGDRAMTGAAPPAALGEPDRLASASAW
jgi:putative SOS response-associated peptidase YedK